LASGDDSTPLLVSLLGQERASIAASVEFYDCSLCATFTVYAEIVGIFLG
jgi:hypothetical protein